MSSTEPRDRSHVSITPSSDLILLTGPSGVGKSTISRGLHQRLAGANWLLWQADLCHLAERDTPVLDEWARSFYESWRAVELPDAQLITVDDRSADDVVDQIITLWAGSTR